MHATVGVGSSSGNIDVIGAFTDVTVATVVSPTVIVGDIVTDGIIDDESHIWAAVDGNTETGVTVAVNRYVVDDGVALIAGVGGAGVVDVVGDVTLQGNVFGADPVVPTS